MKCNYEGVGITHTQQNSYANSVGMRSPERSNPVVGSCALYALKNQNALLIPEIKYKVTDIRNTQCNS